MGYGGKVRPSKVALIDLLRHSVFLPCFLASCSCWCNFGGAISIAFSRSWCRVEGDILHLFFETKNSITMQGDIGIARSTDNGATWEQLGIALDEDWHLSYPYVFYYDGQIYMMPECSAKGEVRLYQALNFPLKWKLEKIIMKKPLVDSFIINHDGKYWLFYSDHSGIGTMKNGQLEIWYSSSPLGPWKPYKKNPIYNTDKSMGARNGGRPFVHNTNLYRVGQDCGDTYTKRVRIFKVEVLTEKDFREVEVPIGLDDGARYHHLDVQKLSSGQWIGIMDGDRVPSGRSLLMLRMLCFQDCFQDLLLYPT